MEQTADADQISVSLTPQREVKERFKDKEYMNWQRACQTLVMLKEFLEPFMNKKAKLLHEYILTRAGARAIVACQRDHKNDNIVRNRGDWWKPRGPVTSKTTQTEQTVDHLADFSQELQQEDETAASSSSAAVETVPSTSEVAVDDNTSAARQNG